MVDELLQVRLFGHMLAAAFAYRGKSMADGLSEAG
jgi:hypothetical protein